MGAHLKFKVESGDNASVANNYLQVQPEYCQLQELGAQVPHFYEEDTAFGAIGEGSVKSSAHVNSKDGVTTLWAALFEKLHNHDQLQVKVLASSCSLRLMTFSLKELNKITNRGMALSGPSADEYQRMLEKANQVNRFPTNFAEKGLSTGGPFSELQDGHEAMIMDFFTVFHTESFRPDMVANRLPIGVSAVKRTLSGLTSKGLLEESYNTFYRLNLDRTVASDLENIQNYALQAAP
jgi:hypothetical protein